MKILYLSYTRSEYSLNSVCIKGLRQNGVDVLDYHVKSRGMSGFINTFLFYRRNSKGVGAVMVGYDSPALAIFLRFFYRKLVVYNAVLSVYERMIISRELARRFSIKAIYYWFLDFLAAHFSGLTLVESDKQRDFFVKIFKISKNKVLRSYIGVDEDNFFHDSSVTKYPVFTVIFRGALMPEAGAEYLIQAAKILEKEDIKFIMQSGGMLLDKTKKLIQEIRPRNLELRSDFIPMEELRTVMQKCHLSIGQLSDHPRLDRTIPHKAYESLIMKLPYLTASNLGIMELLESGKTCITCEAANPESLAEKILWAKNNPDELGKIAENGYALFKDELTMKRLGKSLRDYLDKFIV